MGRLLRSEEKAEAVLAPGLQPEGIVVATQAGAAPTDALGVMAIKDTQTRGGSDGHFRDYARVYDPITGPLRFALFGVLSSKTTPGDLHIDELGRALHANGKLLGVSLSPKTSENNPAEENGSHAQD
jgi:hypothetical protein